MRPPDQAAWNGQTLSGPDASWLGDGRPCKKSVSAIIIALFAEWTIRGTDPAVPGSDERLTRFIVGQNSGRFGLCEARCRGVAGGEHRGRYRPADVQLRVERMHGVLAGRLVGGG